MKTNRAIVVLAGVVAIGAMGLARLNTVASGAQMTAAAKAFLGTLNGQQRAIAMLPYDLEKRTEWHYIPKPTRKGLQVKDMDPTQRRAALDLLRSALSAVGYKKATKIMELESILNELEKDRTGGPIRDPLRYYFTLFDSPTGDDRWGLSVEGHHLSLNFVVDHNRVVSSTPTFLGANPGVLLADYGRGFEKGLRVLADEEQLAFDLLHALSDEQRAKAIIADKAPNDVRDAGKAYPPLSSPVGLAAAEMNDKQVAILRALVEAYAGNLPQDVAAERLATIEANGFGHITFAWSGAERPGIGHDYRIQGKSFLIEFNNTQPDSAGNPANHVHSVWHHRGGNFDIPVE